MVLASARCPRVWPRPSKEHPISRGLFTSPRLVYTGFPFPDGTELSIDAVTTKTLCTRHNSELSPLDQAAVDVHNAVRRLMEIPKVRQQQSRRWPTFELVVDGLLFERWMLKMSINMLQFKKDEFPDWSAPSVLVNSIFGRCPVPGQAGLAMVGIVGDQIRVEPQHHACDFLYRKAPDGANVPGAALISFAGYKFAVSWVDPILSFFPVSLPDHVVSKDAVLPRMRRFKDDSVATVLTFDWSGKWSPTKNAAVVRLRGRWPSPAR